MKTQLLEDIGQSATLSLVPSDRVEDSGSHKAGQDIAQARVDTPVRPRSAFGVWRRKPDDEPVVPAVQQPDQTPPLLAAPPPFEPIAAVEALHVLPQPVLEAAITPAEPTLDTNATQSGEPTPQGPVFDFTFPSPPTPTPDLPRREASWSDRSGRRYLLWGACVLAGALVIQGGRWLYQGSKDAGVLALVADELKPEPQLENAAKRRATVAKEFTLSPDSEVQAASAAFAASTSPRPSPAPTLPPLVLLKPDSAADGKVKPAATSVADREAVRASHQPERGVEQAPADPLPKETHRTAAPKPTRTKVERAPDRPIEREPVMQAAKKSEPESAMSATLKACREHGYHPAQCVAHKCSVTKYGFVCRGT